MSKKKIIIKAFLTAFCVLTGALSANAESCTSAGQTQNKYTASGCSYTTQTRTCCAATGAWSDWGGSCPSCSSSQCWNGSKCADKEAVSRNCSGNVTNATGGTQTRTATCTNGSGWTYGSWTGTCTCKSGYEWKNSSCTRSATPSITLDGCQAVPWEGHNSYTWVGGRPNSAPSADMYATVRVTGYFNGVIYENSVTLNFSAGSLAQVTKEFDLGMPEECATVSCSYSGCKATLISTGWK